ncbi:hypothetical protein, partial [Streptomyces exfoliatus]|uniref:hypothetical protein n=1 Tax=Streptomyces exfoliatus TaxID=1905 RepID=UPI001B807105
MRSVGQGTKNEHQHTFKLPAARIASGPAGLSERGCNPDVAVQVTRLTELSAYGGRGKYRETVAASCYE